MWSSNKADFLQGTGHSGAALLLIFHIAMALRLFSRPVSVKACGEGVQNHLCAY